MIFSAIIEAMFGVSTEIADAAGLGFASGLIVMWLLVAARRWVNRDRPISPTPNSMIRYRHDSIQ